MKSKSFTKLFKSYINNENNRNFVYTFILGAILGPVIVLIITNVVFLFFTGQLVSQYYNQQIEQFIKRDFSKQYKLQIIQEQMNSFGDPSIIVFASDKNTENYCPNFFEGKIESLLPPEVKIYEKRSEIFYNIFPFFPPYRKVYEFKPKLIGEDHAGTNNLFFTDKSIVDLDKDSSKEIVIKMMTITCGSSAESFNFVIGRDSSSYKLFASFPPTAYYNEQEISNTNVNNLENTFTDAVKNNWKMKTLFQEQEIHDGNDVILVNSGTSDDFYDYKDLDEDGTLEFVVGVPIWDLNSKQCFDKEGNWTDLCECHWCPHTWIISVYKYINGEFVIDTNFNSSLLFKTKEKYDLFEIHGYRPHPNNDFGVISLYYGLGFFEETNKDLDFYYKAKSKSKIWGIIKPYYHVE